MSAPASRRTLLRLPLLAAAPMGLAACDAEEPEPAGPSPVTEVGQEVPAPSGEVSAVIDAAGEELGVMLRDAEGTDFWADDYPYAPGDPPGLVWELEQDVLWVLSAEIGTGRIAQDDAGSWGKELDAQPPERIARWV